MLNIKTIQTIAKQEGWELEINKESYDFTTYCENELEYNFSIEKVKDDNLNNLINKVYDQYLNYDVDDEFEIYIQCKGRPSYRAILEDCEEVDGKLEKLSQRLTSYRYIKLRKE